jgi:C-terminal processing protease CtpA/Prc
LQIRKIDDALTAAMVLPGSPADVARIKPGDRILAAGGHDASTLSVRDAAFLMQGPIDSDLTVVIAPAEGGDAKTLKLRLVELVR